MTVLPFLLAAGLNAMAATPAVHRGIDGQLNVKPPRVAADISVDGNLDEAVWGQAAVLTGFSQYAPVDGRPAEQRTDVLVWYSASAMHFGIRATAVSGSVRATLSNRDRITTDDQVQLFLSTFNDGRQALMFAVNPLGVQADGALIEGTSGGMTMGRESADLNPDYVFQSKGRITADGFEVEIRIPFKSLRSPAADPQSWGLHIVRIVKSSGYEDSWAPARRAASSFLGQAGTLEGLTGLNRGLVLDLNPIVTGRADGASSETGWSYDPARPEFGGNLRWGITPNATMNGTINPDFAEVESDAGQFVFDPRQALFYAEKRPFFLDGIEQFSTPNRLIYTRRIVAPLVAGRLNSKFGRTTVAAVSAVDDVGTSAAGNSHPVSNIARIQRDIGGESRVGFVYTDKVDGDTSNRVFGVDGRIAFRKLYSVLWQTAVSRTSRDGEAAAAPLWQLAFNRNGRRFGLRYQLNGIDDDFVAAAGFVSRAGIVNGVVEHRVTRDGKKGEWLERASGSVTLNGTWRYRDFTGGRQAQDKKLWFGGNATLRGGWQTRGTLMIETFGFDQDLYQDYWLGRVQPDGSYTFVPFVGTPRIHNLDGEFELATPQFKTMSASVYYIWGRDENFFEWSSANIIFARYAVDWRPTGQLRVNASYQLQQYNRRSDGSLVGQGKIPRLKVEYQLTPAIFLRFVGQYDANMQDDLRDDSRTNLPIFIKSGDSYERAVGWQRNRFRADWLFSYQPVPGTVVFAGYGSTLAEPEALRFKNLLRVRDGFFLKLSYLFRL